MVPPHLDFERLKAAVSIEWVLIAHGLDRRMRRRGRRLVGPCPIHQGHGPSSFVVDLDRNLWYCFSGCSAGGDVVDLVCRLNRVGYRRAAEILAELAELAPVSGLAPLDRAQHRGPTTAPPPFRPFTRRLCLDPHVPLLERKGISATTAQAFEAGAWRATGFLEGCVGVRLHDPGGQPLGYAGRRTDPHEAQRLGKWKLPPRLPKGNVLYNAHRVRPALRGGAVVVVEGPWDIMRLHQIRVPAVALLGVRLSSRQRDLLRIAGRVIVLLDGDPAGRAGSERVRAALAGAGPEVRVLHPPVDTDPDELGDDELRGLLGPFLPS